MATVRFPFDHFKIGSASEFGSKLAQAGYEIPMSENLSSLRGSFVVNGRRIENSMAVQPLEGLDAKEDGSPSELMHARYEKLAGQGAGVLWVEATAVCPEGRDSTRQLWLHAGSLEGFRALVRTIDEAAAKAGHKPPYKVLQLTHSGRCSVDAAGRPAPMAAFASPYLDPVMGTPQIVTDEYLDQLQERVGEAAALAAEAGFDAVELKLCHQYLFKELLCAYTRSGRYGGSQENRFRFALGAVDQIRRRLGSRIDIVVRLNAYDGIPWPYGWGMQPHPDGAPKNVLPVDGGAPAGGMLPANGAAQVYSAPADSIATGTASTIDWTRSNWPGNPQYQQLAAEGVSNWPGNPDYQITSGRESSNWSGNPSPLTISDEEKSSWQGNPGFERSSDSRASSWQGNAAFQRSSVSEKSNWSGNPSPLNISDAEKSSWQGNPRREHVEGTAASNWPGNPDFIPEACRNCTASPEACAACETAKAVSAFAIPPMPGPMRVDLSEVKELMQQLYRRGIRLFNLSTNSPRFAPSGSGFLDNFNETAQVDPFAGVAALLQATREIRQIMPGDVRIVGTGLSWFGPFSANVGAGGITNGWFDIAGFGRSVMADNGFIPSILQGRQPDPAKACVGCDGCFKLFFAGLPTGCPMQHSAYADLFQTMCTQNGGGNVIY